MYFSISHSFGDFLIDGKIIAKGAQVVWAPSAIVLAFICCKSQNASVYYVPFPIER